jgi:hypothetical protein
MAGVETTVERLRKFLRELSPGARSLLVGELERSVLRGDAVAGGDLVLQELRRIMREQRDGTARLDESAQLLFKPLELFLVDDRGDHKHLGRVARTSLEALWSWVQRDLLPDDAESLAADVSEAMLAGDQDRASYPGSFKIASPPRLKRVSVSRPRMAKFADEYCSRSVLLVPVTNWQP